MWCHTTVASGKSSILFEYEQFWGIKSSWVGHVTLTLGNGLSSRNKMQKNNFLLHEKYFEKYESAYGMIMLMSWKFNTLANLMKYINFFLFRHSFIVTPSLHPSISYAAYPSG